MAVPAMSSRMSIERYLKAPLSDEPALAPAINDAIRTHVPRDWIDSPATLYNSRETSVDVHSEGQPTFPTSGSIPETVNTLYTVEARSKPHRAAIPNYSTSPLSTKGPQINHSEDASLNNPALSSNISPIHMAREWAERVEMYIPGYSPEQGIDYHAKAEAEIMKIQEKAKGLELLMQQFKIERNDKVQSATTLTDESARVRMAANSKSAWILGEDAMNAHNFTRPNVVLSTTDDIPDSPRSIGKAHEIPYGRVLRKSKSNGALDDGVHRNPAISKIEDIVEQQQSKRPRFYCTFC
jgi:hypothetical protein